MYDQNIYHWQHIDGSEEKCTVYDLRIKYDIPQRGLRLIVTAKQNSSSGWSIVGKGPGASRLGNKAARYDSKIYHWVHIDGREEYLTRYDFYTTYNLPSCAISDIVNGKEHKKSCHGWSLKS